MFERRQTNEPFNAVALYDLSTDPRERHNLLDAPDKADLRARAQKELNAYSDEYWTVTEQTGDSSVSQETIDALNALGYGDIDNK